METVFSARSLSRHLRLLTAFTILYFVSGPAASQTCGTDYVIQEGETLAGIAQQVYGDRSQWSLIFYANQDRLGSNMTLLVPGQAIRIPCTGSVQGPGIDESAPASSSAPAKFVLSNMISHIEFLTAEGYTPYADRTLQNGGLLLDLLTSSMGQIEDQSQGSFSHNISWVNDWAAHLNPLLITRAFDVGIPWTKPDCSVLATLDTNSRYRCEKFFFSDPLYEDVTALFLRNDSSINFRTDEDVLGKTLCQTRGSSTFHLNKEGRGWLTDNRIVLMQPQTPQECFRLLSDGTVNAVVISDLTGRAIAASMGILDRIHVAERPVHIETLHAVMAKTHPHARTILYYINSSFARLRETGQYDKIVSGHLDRFWTNLEQTSSPKENSTEPEGDTEEAVSR
ncbi:MAG: transporter substrate-binding domain-containing protein [Hyphomicrobiales bacterium]|nr:transporter substrate-binding domain-containing protein [Hyphomicrobiales bacterium]